MHLTPEEHDEILNLFDCFESFPDTFLNHSCMDDFNHSIEYITPSLSKIVEASGCALNHGDDSPYITQLRDIVAAMHVLADTIYARQAPWIGLSMEASLDWDTYGIGESIMLTYRIANPTDKVRSLHFTDQYQFYFYIDKQNSSFYYRYPTYDPESQGDSTQIMLQPGEVHEIIYTWDQTIVDGNPDRLNIGYYTMVTGLLSGNLGEEVMRFEVVDKSVPLGGYIIPCGKDRFCDSSEYTFALSIRNYTADEVTLHFPYEQKIYVELYDSGAAHPWPLAYKGPKNLIPAPSSITLQPGDTLVSEFYDDLVFEHTVPMDSLDLSYFWVYVKIKLLISDFDFSRDAKLQIW